MNGSPIAVDIDKDNRLVVARQLAPCQHLNGFFQGTDAARHHDKGIGIVEHDLLAFVHRFGLDLLVKLEILRFDLGQEAGDDTHNLAARLVGSARGPCP